jgi:hypothetical protein
VREEKEVSRVVDERERDTAEMAGQREIERKEE